MPRGIHITMLAAAITVDVDRDVNLPERGRYGAVSSGSDSTPRFESARKGLQLVAELLDEMGIRGTFFMEGDTVKAIAKRMDVETLLRRHEVGSHGMCHEDFTGEDTGICLTGPEMEGVIDDSASTIESICGRRPVGFRAPYLHIDETALGILADKGFLYDSSRVKAIREGELRPWRIAGNLLELPIASGKDAKGKKIVSYLWPMHEGKRQPSDYVQFAGQVKSGCFIIATHSWHMVETFDRGKLDREATQENLQNVRTVLEGALDAGLEFKALEDLARRYREG
jgi:hypothetical protein